MERKSARSSLSTLHALGCLELISPSSGKRWRLRERGLRPNATANQLHLRNLVVRCAEEGHPSPMVQRGVRWLLAHIQHTAGIYGFFAALAQAARQQPEQCLCWWETGALCERRYRVGEQWYNLRPDALAEFRAGSQQFRFWLEWDRGTMNAGDLAVKFDAYRHFVASQELARDLMSLPRLLCVAPDIAQERRIHRVAQGRRTQPLGPAMWTTTEVLLKAHGPIARSGCRSHRKVTSLTWRVVCADVTCLMHMLGERAGKKPAIDAFTATTGSHGKYAIWLLNHTQEEHPTPQLSGGTRRLGQVHLPR